jgi:hypothetical protein
MAVDFSLLARVQLVAVLDGSSHFNAMAGFRSKLDFFSCRLQRSARWASFTICRISVPDKPGRP